MNGTTMASASLMYLLFALQIDQHYWICSAFASSTIPLRSPSRKEIIQDVVPSKCLVDDDEECVIPPDEATVDHILNESALSRGLEIAAILLSKVVRPLAASIIRNGNYQNWEEFWANDDGGISNGEVLTRALEDLGPVYVKFGQALAARPDAIPLSLANSLSKLQDCMAPFEADQAKQIVTKELIESNRVTGRDAKELLKALSADPVAAASVGQVYKAHINNLPVAVKVQRPGIREVMERDAALLQTLAAWIESIPAPDFIKADRLVAAELEAAVTEFFDRIFLELDYTNEASNAAAFEQLYSTRGGKFPTAIVPKVYPEFCTENVLVMEWLDGTKLTSIDKNDPSTTAENLAVIKQAIDCTINQLLETGVLHADPHGGNLLKIQTPEGPQLGYLDFGMLSYIPQEVRDALVCAVVHLVFDGDSEALASLLLELQIVPADVVEDPQERKALIEALNQTMNEVLVYSEPRDPATIEFPELDFNSLIVQLTKLVPRFKFQLPPYFMNKARALGTLEGMARSMDSNFNILQMLYPYALNRIMENPTQSRVMDDTLENLIRSPETSRVDIGRISKLLDDSALLTGYRKSKVIRDILKTAAGRRLARKVVMEQLRKPPSHTRRKINGLLRL